MFGKNEQPVTDVAGTTATPATTAVIPAPVAGPVAVAAPSSSGLLLGDFIPAFEDIIIPRVNIVQNMGELKDTFELGSLVYDQKAVLFVPPRLKDGAVVRAATAPVNMVVIGFRPTRYVEKTTGGARGLIVKNVAEVASNGGTTDYQEWKLKEKSGCKLFQPLVDAFIAVERPADYPDDDTVFNYPVGDRKFALALWAMKGAVYTAAAKKVFFTARKMGILRKGGYPSYEYAVTTKEETYGTGNKAWVPVCIATKPTTPEFLEFVRNALEAPATE